MVLQQKYKSEIVTSAFRNFVRTKRRSGICSVHAEKTVKEICKGSGVQKYIRLLSDATNFSKETIPFSVNSGNGNAILRFTRSSKPRFPFCDSHPIVATPSSQLRPGHREKARPCRFLESKCTALGGGSRAGAIEVRVSRGFVETVKYRTSVMEDEGEKRS